MKNIITTYQAKKIMKAWAEMKNTDLAGIKIRARSNHIMGRIYKKNGIGHFRLTTEYCVHYVDIPFDHIRMRYKGLLEFVLGSMTTISLEVDFK